MGLGHIREAGRIFPSVLDPILVLGEARWKVFDKHSNCIALARTVMTREDIRHRVHAQLAFPGDAPTQITVDLLFSPYQLLEGFQLDATYPDELLSVSNPDGALQLTYRRLISEGRSLSSWQDKAKKLTGKLVLPQPILLRETEQPGQFKLSYPPVLNGYIAADGSEKIRFEPASDDQCVPDSQKQAQVKATLLEVLERFSIDGESDMPRDINDEASEREAPWTTDS